LAIEDITERERAESELRASEEQHRTLVKNSPYCIHEIDLAGRLMSVNPAGLRMLGVNEERDIVGSPYLDVVGDEDRGDIGKLLESAYQGESSEFEFTAVNGRIFQSSLIPITDDHGAVVRLMGLTQDITLRKQATEALAENQRALSNLMSNMPGMAYRTLNDGNWTMDFVSEGCMELTGYDPSDVIGVKQAFVKQISRPDDREWTWNTLQGALREHKPFQLTFRIVTAKGEEKWVWEHGRGVYSPEGNLLAMEGFITDITERKRAEVALASERERFKDFAEVAADYFWEMDGNLKFTYLSGRFEEITGVLPSQLLGQTRREFWTGRIGDSEQWEQHFRDLEASRQFEDVELPWVCPNGQARVLRISGKPLFDSLDAFQGYRGAVRDVTEAHHMAQQLAHQATHDALTGLINRRAFEHRLQRVLDTAQAEQAEHALCYLDLDQFKIINDTCGHVAGDELLRQLGGLLQQKVRRRDTLARLGGDEFGVLMEHCSLKHALRVANALRVAVEEYRFAWEGKSFNVGVSMGLVPITETSESIAGVLGAADAACYTAKDEGRNRIHVYREDDAELAKRHGEMRWVARIQRALEEDRFQLSFQPIVPVTGADQKGAHYELLLRLKDEEGRIVLPAAFLPAAERYNLATKVDRWVIRSAFEWLAFHPEHVERLYLCEINISGWSLGDGEFLKWVTEQFLEAAIPPGKVCFEVTETAAIANLTSAKHFMQTLKAVGCRFALDDFGSGLSSFAYLKTLPVDFLKIDGLFVKDIADDPTDLAMVKSINEIGHTMGKQTIAEFVESEAILEKLRPPNIGIDYAQGYHIGRPKPIDELVV